VTRGPFRSVGNDEVPPVRLWVSSSETRTDRPTSSTSPSPPSRRQNAQCRCQPAPPWERFRPGGSGGQPARFKAVWAAVGGVVGTCRRTAHRRPSPVSGPRGRARAYAFGRRRNRRATTVARTLIATLPTTGAQTGGCPVRPRRILATSRNTALHVGHRHAPERRPIGVISVPSFGQVHAVSATSVMFVTSGTQPSRRRARLSHPAKGHQFLFLHPPAPSTWLIALTR
jgi:hypothetical protein